jgi:hypothetical protein
MLHMVEFVRNSLVSLEITLARTPKIRYKFIPQMNLFSPIMRNSIVKELKGISNVLDATPSVVDRVFKDLTATSRTDTDRKGMTAEQVLRCAILKQYRELTYEELAFHLEDSDAFRSFARLEMGQYPSKSILQDNIKAITEETWETIHRDILEFAAREKIEKGRTIRVDATVVETDIRHPRAHPLRRPYPPGHLRWPGACPQTRTCPSASSAASSCGATPPIPITTGPSSNSTN